MESLHLCYPQNCKSCSKIKIDGNFKDINIGKSFSNLDLIPNDIENEVREVIDNCLISKKSVVKNFKSVLGEIQFFIEVIPPPIHLIIYGGNYDIYSMVRIAKEVGWKTSVVCNHLP